MVQQRAQESEVNEFIKECDVMEERVFRDIRTLKELWEKYGYQAPRDTQKRASR